MTNRTKTAAITALTALAAIPAIAQKPNILIVMTDEQNFRTLGCYRQILGDEFAYPWGDGVAVETPNIDNIAQRGVLCDNFYAIYPLSSPSRAAFFTGLFPQSTAVVENDIPMLGETETIGTILQRKGYRTGYFGKWHLDGASKPGWAPERDFGFESNEYMYNRGHWKNIKERLGKPYVEVDPERSYSYPLGDADEFSFATDYMTDRAIEYMESVKGSPFCCILSIADPHGPNSVREPYSSSFATLNYERPQTADMSHEGLPDWAAAGLPKRTIIEESRGMSNYFGMVSCIDDNMGKVLRFLEESGLDESTIVIFTSDHGDMLGEHGRDNKRLPYEASAKVPFLISYRGVLGEGVVAQSTLGSADFLPTILSLMGVESEVAFEGRDRAAALRGEKLPRGWEEMVVSRSRRWIAAITPELKLIYSIRQEDGTPAPVVLYNTSEDPFETTNVYGDRRYTRDVKQMAAFLKRHLESTDEMIEADDSVFEAISSDMR